jgi:cytochrome c oxidase subunit IV
LGEVVNTKEKQVDHITPLRVYLTVGIALIFLTGLTVKVSLIHLGAWNAIAALTIAAAKALLVALFFMHLLYDKKIYAVIVGVTLVILAILISLTMADILKRGDIYQYQALPIKPQAEIYKQNTKDSTQQDTTELTKEDIRADTAQGHNPDILKANSDTISKNTEKSGSNH